MASVQVELHDDRVVLRITAGQGGKTAEAHLTVKDAEAIGEALFKTGRSLDGLERKNDA